MPPGLDGSAPANGFPVLGHLPSIRRRPPRLRFLPSCLLRLAETGRRRCFFVFQFSLESPSYLPIWKRCRVHSELLFSPAPGAGPKCITQSKVKLCRRTESTYLCNQRKHFNGCPVQGHPAAQSKAAELAQSKASVVMQHMTCILPRSPDCPVQGSLACPVQGKR